MKPRILITTADDFGASAEVNEAVAVAYRQGILRFASLMVDGPAAPDAAAKARALPGLGVGVHLELCPARPAAWGLRLLFDREERRRLEPRLAAQIERCLAFGVAPTHLDCHCNVHVHPAIFPAVARLARRYGIGRIRWPAAELGPSLAYARAKGGGAAVPAQALLAGAFGLLGFALKGLAGGIFMPRCYGMLRSGMMTEDYVIWLLRRLPQGCSEMYFHPTVAPGSEARGRPTPSHQSVSELKTLLSPRVRRALGEEGIELLGAPLRP